MTSLGLAEVAVQAELLRLRRQVRQTVRRALHTVACAVFGIFALVLLHLAAGLWLAPRIGTIATLLILAAIDSMVAATLYFLARKRIDPVAEEALAIRQNALQSLAAGSALGGMLRLLRQDNPAAQLGGLVVESMVRAIIRR